MFRRSERDERVGALHGADGPIPISRVPEDAWTPLDRAFVEAAVAMGYDFVEDLNGAREQLPGIGPRPQNVKDGVRMNAASTYLAMARSRPNRTLVPDTPIHHVIVEDGIATGARAADGESWSARDVILCAGAYGTPAILIRSGVGPAGQLSDLDVL
jgi:choline dehydrogenase